MTERAQPGDIHDIQPDIPRHYERLYTENRSDSPKESRKDIKDIIMRRLREDTIQPRRILNIGAGAQRIERELRDYRSGNDPKLVRAAEFITLDVARIPEHRRMARNLPNVTHKTANAAEQTVDAQSVGMVVSNMAIDLAPKEALSEAAAALAPGGTFAFTLHHPDMMRSIFAQSKSQGVQRIVGFALEQGYFYETAEDIKREFGFRGLKVNSVAMHYNTEPKASVGMDKWWLVTGTRK